MVAVVEAQQPVTVGDCSTGHFIIISQTGVHQHAASHSISVLGR